MVGARKPVVVLIWEHEHVSVLNERDRVINDLRLLLRRLYSMNLFDLIAGDLPEGQVDDTVTLADSDHLRLHPLQLLELGHDLQVLLRSKPLAVPNRRVQLPHDEVIDLSHVVIQLRLVNRFIILVSLTEQVEEVGKEGLVSCPV